MTRLTSTKATLMGALGERIAAANTKATERIRASAPALLRIRSARDVISDLGTRVLLHAGPPVTPETLCGPMRGAVLGALVYEGWARTPADAEALVANGDLTFRCTHDAGVVGPMAGIISGSMPLFEVRDLEHGTVAYAPVNEGIGAVLRFGAYDEAVVARLRWIQEVLAPALDWTLQRLGEVQLNPLMARALAMGDELHQRNIAATGLLYRVLAPVLADSPIARDSLAAVLHFLATNDQFFLNLAMAAAKATMDGVRDIPYSTVVCAMSRNGVEFGVRVSGLDDQWFSAPAPVPVGLYFPGFSAEDANPDMGDSAILETLGLGGFAMAAAPALVGFLGLDSVAAAVAMTRAMGEITLMQSPQFTIPGLDFEGVPTAIDVRRVVQLEVTPVINTGIAHRTAGIGQIGAGVVRAPLSIFQDALVAFASRYTPEAGGGSSGRYDHGKTTDARA